MWNMEEKKIQGFEQAVRVLPLRLRQEAMALPADQRARVEELRRCAAVRGERFFYCVWLRQPDLAAFEAACRGLGQLDLLPDRVLARRAWEQETARSEGK